MDIIAGNAHVVSVQFTMVSPLRIRQAPLKNQVGPMYCFMTLHAVADKLLSYV
jgi:hypothetical protein